LALGALNKEGEDEKDIGKETLRKRKKMGSAWSCRRKLSQGRERFTLLIRGIVCKKRAKTRNSPIRGGKKKKGMGNGNPKLRNVSRGGGGHLEICKSKVRALGS